MAVKVPKDLTVSDNGFLFDPVTGHTFSLNAVGICVFNLAKKGLDAKGIAERLSEEYEVEAADAVGDAADFLMALRDFGLLR